MKKKNLLLSLVLCLSVLFSNIPVMAATGYTPAGDFVVDESLIEFAVKTINGNLYVKNGASYTAYGNITVNGDVYLFGDMNCYGNLYVNGTLNCLNYYSPGMTFSAGNYSNGNFTNFGTLKSVKLNVTDNYLNINIPDVPEPTPAPTPTPTITPQPTPTPDSPKISASKFKIDTISKRIYNGAALKPYITVKYNGKVLDKYVDYVVKYDNNIKPGKAKCTITGLGRYTGSKVVYFYIAPAKQTINSLKSTQKKTISVGFKKAVGSTGTQVCYSTNSRFKSPKYAISTGTGKKLAGLVSKKTYYVKIRPYKTVGKTKIYGAYSTAKKINVK